MASEFGRKGGTSATTGKRGETIRSPLTGMTKRVFKGQRWLVIAQQDEDAPCDLLAFRTKEEAERVNDRIYRTFRPDVHFVEQAEVVQ